MERRRRTVDRDGNLWTVSLVRHDEAEAEDFRFWFEELTPDERVAAVAECLLSSLEARGIENPADTKGFSRRSTHTA